MTPLATRMLATARKFELWTPGDKILVSLSGGPDSVALLTVMCEVAHTEQLVISALHMNFGLRDQQSDGDEDFCRRLCDSLGIDLHVGRPVEPCRGSVQAWARAERLLATGQLVSTHQYDSVAMGHTAEDRAETVILKLFRGAGPDGLGEVLPLRGAQSIRPLVQERKSALLEYLRATRTPFRIDRSNFTDAYLRNRVRRNLIPMVESMLEVDATQVLNEFADSSALESQYLQSEAQPLLESAHFQSGFVQLTVAEIAKYPMAVRLRALRTIAKSLGCSPARAQSTQLCSVTDWATGRTIELGNGVMVERGRTQIWIYQGEAFDHVDRRLSLSIPGMTELPDGSTLQVMAARPQTPFPDGRAGIRLAVPTRLADWSLRTVQQGDRMRPFGMSGTRLVSDLLSEAGVPRFKRPQSWVMTDGDQILWLLGIRQSEIGRVEKDSQRVYEFRWQPISSITGESLA